MQSRDAGRLYTPLKALALTPSPALAPHLSRSVSLTLMRFWLPNISKHEYVALSFIASHKSRANSTPAPDVTRVFVLQRSERKWLASTLCKRIVAVLLSGTGLIGSPLRCAVYHRISLPPFPFFRPYSWMLNDLFIFLLVIPREPATCTIGSTKTALGQFRNSTAEIARANTVRIQEIVRQPHEPHHP